jgi:hypothetical protein
MLSHLPQRHEREKRRETSLFPRTEARVIAGPPKDRMMREDRRITKRELARIAARPEPDYVHD